MLPYRIYRKALVTLVICCVLPSISHAGFLERLFAPKPELWARWEAHDPEDKRRIDHSAWDGFLEHYTSISEDGIVRVAYGAVSEADRASLKRYLETLSSIPVSGYSRKEQFAYWVNLYNAQTVAIVLDHYPVDSIRDIDIAPGLLSDGPWGKKVLVIEGRPVSLDDIEHRILRPIWQDPRIHYAVNCASIGCPNLQQESYRADNLERLLDAGAVAYINHPRGVLIENDALTVSSIYSWFIGDFNTDGGVLGHLQRYAKPELRAALAAFDDPAWYEYDWGLNDDTSAIE